MDGSPGSVVSRRYCFSFDWNEEESLCLIGTGAVSRHEPGEQDSNGHIDSTATSFCYYERLWDMDISSLHHFSTTHNPMIGRLVQVEGEVTATIAAPTVEVVDEDDLLGGLPEGFFLQQTDLRAMCSDDDALPAVFVRSHHFKPIPGSVVAVTAIAFVFNDKAELTDVVLEDGLTTVMHEVTDPTPPPIILPAEITL